MYEVRFTKRFDKLFHKLDRQVQRDILKEIENLRRTPELGERLHGTLSDLFRIKVKDFRVVYHIHSSENVMEFVFVDHRKHVYEELERLRQQKAI